MRDQLRLALGVLAVLGVVLGGVPAALALIPGLRTAEVFGFRLAWLLLGVVAYPVLVGMAWFHVRHAERVERDFTELLNGPDPSAPDPDPTPVPGETAPHPAAEPAPGPASVPGPASGAADELRSADPGPGAR